MTRRLTMDDVWGLAKSSLSACKEHNETTNKMATMNSELWNEIGFKQSKIKELQETIQDKDFEIEDPTAETGLRELVRPLVLSGIYDSQEVRIAVESCFDELGLERPDGPGGGRGPGG